jgi:hypothetical protein
MPYYIILYYIILYYIILYYIILYYIICFISLIKNNQHYALNCTTALFNIRIPKCFGSGLP